VAVCEGNKRGRAWQQVELHIVDIIYHSGIRMNTLSTCRGKPVILISAGCMPVEISTFPLLHPMHRMLWTLCILE
jgi:hypothetical protein